MQLQWHLGEEDFFKNLPTEKREFLARSVRRPIKKHSLIFAEDELTNSCFYLEEGSVKISRITLWGKEPIIFVRKAVCNGSPEILHESLQCCSIHIGFCGIEAQGDRQSTGKLLPLFT